MRFLLPPIYLKPAIELLQTMPLPGPASRARTKLIHLLQGAYASFAEDEYALVTQYATTSDDGTPVFDSDGTFTLKDPQMAKEFHDQHQALFNRRTEVAGPTYEQHASDIQAFLDASPMELTGIQAEAYNVLYDAIIETLDEDKDRQ